MAARSRTAAKRRASAAEPRILVRKIRSWSELVDLIGDGERFRNWAFRGQGDAAWRLDSSLARHIDVSRVAPAVWPLQEARIRRIFERKSHAFVPAPPQGDELEWLALMQHHGAPTRLLDFTWSPFVAAFFALERARTTAAIWALNLALLDALHARHRVDGVDVRDADPRERRTYERVYLHNRHRFVWQGDPFRMPERIIAQSGTFLVSGHLGFTVAEILERYPGRGVLLLKLELDTPKLRREAMAALYSMNITQATLFPGIDGLARSMAYEFEYSWEVDPATGKPRESLTNPQAQARDLRRKLAVRK